jgi:16S rRNA processing protein RimM
MEAEAFSGGGASLAVKFAGCDTPEAARALTGSELLLDRSEAAALGPGEYYVEDLKGLEVLGPAAESLGRVTDIVEGGGGLLMEIELSSTGELRLAPFRDGFVGEIDTEGGWVRLEAPWVLE